jgi:ATP-dependent Clp protease adaptor protein ClpS
VSLTTASLGAARWRAEIEAHTAHATYPKGRTVASVRTLASVSPSATLEKSTVRKPYPNFKVIVLNDEENTFEHVANCLVKYIPSMTPDRAWELTVQIDAEGQAIVWVGPQEQAELYHMQLGGAGLTMAPIEAA